jgi:hypothetical protein
MLGQGRSQRESHVTEPDNADLFLVWHSRMYTKKSAGLWWNVRTRAIGKKLRPAVEAPAWKKR